MYSVLFTEIDVKKACSDLKKEMEKKGQPIGEDPLWMNFVNPNSLSVKKDAKMWNLHKKAKVDDRFQFERMGYFVITEESNPKKGKFILNRIVTLKEAKGKVVK